MKTLIAKIALIASICTFAGQASAITIVGENDPTNNSADFTWSVNGNGELVVTLENTSNFTALLTGFQFEIADDVSGISDLVDVSGTLANDGWVWTTGVTGCDADECIITGGNLNGGRPGEAVDTGATATFTFVGTFADPSTIVNVMVRFQQTGSDGEGSDHGYGCEIDCDPAEVPEPGTLALFGLGLFGLRMARRRQAQRL